MKKWARRAAKTIVAVAFVYLVLCAALFAIMTRPPDVIGTFFKWIPAPLFAAVPLERLWVRAREGTLEAGDVAPAFDLAALDKRSRVSLASLRGKPAVLVFGSYT